MVPCDGCKDACRQSIGVRFGPVRRRVAADWLWVLMTLAGVARTRRVRQLANKPIGEVRRPAIVTTRGSSPNARQPADSVAAARSAQTSQPSSDTPSDLVEDSGVIVWQTGQSTIDYLIEKGRLEAVSESEREQAADRLIQDASKRLGSARRLMESDTGIRVFVGIRRLPHGRGLSAGASVPASDGRRWLA